MPGYLTKVLSYLFKVLSYLTKVPSFLEKVSRLLEKALQETPEDAASTQEAALGNAPATGTSPAPTPPAPTSEDQKARGTIFVDILVVLGIEGSLIAAHFTAHLTPLPDLFVIASAFLVGVLYLPCIAKLFTKFKNYYMAAVFWGFAMVVLLIGVHASLVALVRPGIKHALDGRPVRLIELINFEAIPAHVKWLDRNKREPSLLNDPNLLYLGHGPRGDILLACGNIVAVSPDLLSIEDGFHLRTKPVNRNTFCKDYHNY